jgi:hypothetical protein
MLRTFNKITLFAAPVIVSPLSSLSLLIYFSSVLSHFLTSQVHVAKRQISNSDVKVNAGGDEGPGLRKQDYTPHGIVHYFPNHFRLPSPFFSSLPSLCFFLSVSIKKPSFVC